MIKKLLSILIISSTALTAFAFKGQYEGAIDLGGMKLRLVTEFAEKDTKTIGLLYSIDQSKEPIAMRSVSIKNDVLTFKIPTLDISFKGKIKGENIDGTFKQFGKSFPLILKKSKNELKDALNANNFELTKEAKEKIVGEWLGEIKPTSLTTLRLQIVVEETQDEKCSGYLISIDQSNAKIPLTEISVNGKNVTLSASTIGANITGKLAKSAINGTFKQGGFFQKITLKKLKKK